MVVYLESRVETSGNFLPNNCLRRSYLQVYKGLHCLNSVQISALLALDTRRALDRAAKSVKALDEQCCSVMAVFGDIQHSLGKFNSSEY